MAQTFDIAVLGETPAGCAAARYLAARGRSVALVRAPHAEVESPLADWVPGNFFRMADLPSALRQRVGGAAFKRVEYHDAELSRQEQRTSRSVLGYFLPAGGLTEATRDAARKAGAKCRSSRTAPTLRLDDSGVRIIGTTQTQARLLLLAHGRPSDVVSDLSLPIQTTPSVPLIVTGLDVPLDGDDGGLDGALHVVESRERSQMGLFFVVDDTLHMRIVSNSAAAGNPAAELSTLVADLQGAEILPRRVALGKAKGGVWYPPAAALDLETHVVKRCLLVGTAGGFVDAVGGQTLWPSVRSALLAARVADDALDTDDPQAALEDFRKVWRKELGDYLRPPSTSLQMLLPLLFANRRIVGRFTDALLFGKAI